MKTNSISLTENNSPLLLLVLLQKLVECIAHLFFLPSQSVVGCCCCSPLWRVGTYCSASYDDGGDDDDGGMVMSKPKFIPFFVLLFVVAVEVVLVLVLASSSVLWQWSGTRR